MPVAVMITSAPSLGDGGRLTQMRNGRDWMLGVSVCMLALSVNPYVSITV
jgi:hypothetical protein